MERLFLYLMGVVYFLTMVNNKKTFDYWSMMDYAICGLIGFILRCLQDRKSEPKPDFLFQMVASIAMTWLAYFSYSFYKIQFTAPEIWTVCLSWLGAFIFTTGDYIAKNGLVIYARKLAEDFLSFTKKK